VKVDGLRGTPMKKLLLITDAWLPQTNGVVTTYKNVIHELESMGVQTEVIHPGLFRSVPCPGYREIPLALDTWKIGRMIDDSAADHIHVAVEGPLGLAARFFLKRKGLQYTTSFHTRFPEYIKARFPFVSLKLGYRFMRWFHRRSRRIMVTTPGMHEDLARYGFDRMTIWGRGVNTDLFKPADKTSSGMANPKFLYVGRVAVEKNVEAFLELELPGEKIVVGDGPSRAALEKQYPQVKFVGYKYGEELAAYYRAADVFVFPSRTDTFGLVMLEAMACGTPVAAFPVPGPIDVVSPWLTGILDHNLQSAALRALKLDRAECRKFALDRSWRACAQTLLDNLTPAKAEAFSASETRSPVNR
jgi:glycosyltransferase involved in cell wall biosynthesis